MKMVKGPSGRWYKDYSGDRFGRLVVKEIAKRSDGNHGIVWLCLCDCGRRTKVRADSFSKPNPTESCGCLQKENCRGPKPIHGMSDTPTYNAYLGMWERCNNPNQDAYRNYGAKGIRVCQRWSEPIGFLDFIAKIGERPKGRYSLDRKDTHGHYSCGDCEECLANGWTMNVRWATPFQQMNNRTDNHFLVFDGRRQTIAEWSRELGIGPSVIWNRIRGGATVEDALTRPLRKVQKRRVIVDGMEMSLHRAAIILGVDYASVYKSVVVDNMPIEEVAARLRRRHVSASI